MASLVLNVICKTLHVCQSVQSVGHLGSRSMQLWKIQLHYIHATVGLYLCMNPFHVFHFMFLPHLRGKCGTSDIEFMKYNALLYVKLLNNKTKILFDE